MGPRRRNESWGDWKARMTVRARRSAQKSVSRDDIVAMFATPESFTAWLSRQAPDAEVGSLHTPINSVLAEYLWAILDVFAMTADSIVWDGGVIDSAELPLWVQSLNQVEARHMETVPDNKHTWTGSEVLAMMREALGKE
jgi:hypothetical protein